MDVLGMIYDALMADPSIKEKANGRIKFYEFPETGEVTAHLCHSVLYTCSVVSPIGSALCEDLRSL